MTLTFRVHACFSAPLKAVCSRAADRLILTPLSLPRNPSPARQVVRLPGHEQGPPAPALQDGAADRGCVALNAGWLACLLALLSYLCCKGCRRPLQTALIPIPLQSHHPNHDPHPKPPNPTKQNHNPQRTSRPPSSPLPPSAAATSPATWTARASSRWCATRGCWAAG
jgi:hypothetical protein